jgi:hypothetical protein
MSFGNLFQPGQNNQVVYEQLPNVNGKYFLFKFLALCINQLIYINNHEYRIEINKIAIKDIQSNQLSYPSPIRSNPLVISYSNQNQQQNSGVKNLLYLERK